MTTDKRLMRTYRFKLKALLYFPYPKTRLAFLPTLSVCHGRGTYR